MSSSSKVETATAELVYHTPVICGECPVWDERQRKLYWADLTAGTIFVFDPEEGTNTPFDIGKPLGALALREEGGLVLAMTDGFVYFDPESGKVTPIINPESDKADHQFGDGKCDAVGRFWAGTYHNDISEPLGSLYSLEGNEAKKRVGGLILSNGMDWSRDDKTFYHVDTIARTVSAYDFEVSSGEIGNRREILRFPEGRQLPDGLTVDAAGFLWIAVFNGGKVIRIDPETGEVNFEVGVKNASQVTSCTFGGAGLDELYITTAKEVGGPYGIAEEAIPLEANAGGLFRVKVPFSGVAPNRFKG